MRYLLLTLLLTLNPFGAIAPALAVAGVVGGQSASAINAAQTLAQLQEMYRLMVEELEQLKAQSQTLSRLNDIYKEGKDQIDAVRNFGDADYWQRRLSQDLDRLNPIRGLDNPNLTAERRMEIISAAIDERILRSDEDRSWLITQKALFDAQQLMDELKGNDDDKNTPDPATVNSALEIQEKNQRRNLIIQSIKSLDDEIDSTFK